MKLNDAVLQSVLRKGVVEIIVEGEFVSLLRKGDPLRLKMGFDPSRPDIHLGHVIGLRKLRQLQELGHKVILIVGDWTAQIGDPSGESATRPMLTHEQVMANAETYLEQFFRVVDKDRTETVLQSEWFGKFTLATVLDLTRRFTLAQFLERDDFARRYKANRPIAITEFLYPLLQAYDSVAIKSDVEFGGTDQKFNLLVGRQLQSMMGQKPQQCFLMPLLVGTDGVQKMSKSLDNYVGVDEPAQDMFGKLMSISDSLMLDYFDYLTDVTAEEVGEMRRELAADSVNPMDLKKKLAADITGQFYPGQDVLDARAHFERTVQRRQLPEDIPQVGFKISSSTVSVYQISGSCGAREINCTGEGDQVTASDLIWAAGLAKSKGEAKRLLAQSAVEVDQVRHREPWIQLRDGVVIRVGRRRFARLSNLDETP